jgi:parvulin-like peptidyl-prolyl isomerase
MLKPQMKFVSLALALLLFALAPGVRAEVVDSIAAIVEDRVITRTEVDELLYQTMGITSDPQALAAALEELIEQRLVELHADRMGVNVSDEEIKQEVASIRQRNNMDALAFRTAVESQGMEWEEYMDEIRSSIRRTKVVGMALRSKFDPSEERLHEYYLKHADEFRAVSGIRLTHLMADNEAGRAKLEQVRANVTMGGDFTLEAEKIGATPADTGMVAFDQLAEPIRDAVKDAKEGQLSPVVTIAERYHLFRVEQRDNSGVPPFKDVREQVRERYLREGGQELFRAWLDQLKEEAFIERRL